MPKRNATERQLLSVLLTFRRVNHSQCHEHTDPRLCLLWRNVAAKAVVVSRVVTLEKALWTRQCQLCSAFGEDSRISARTRLPVYDTTGVAERIKQTEPPDTECATKLQNSLKI